MRTKLHLVKLLDHWYVSPLEYNDTVTLIDLEFIGTINDELNKYSEDNRNIKIELSTDLDEENENDYDFSLISEELEYGLFQFIDSEDGHTFVCSIPEYIYQLFPNQTTLYCTII